MGYAIDRAERVMRKLYNRPSLPVPEQPKEVGEAVATFIERLKQRREGVAQKKGGI
jgi:hypothetical protein